MHIIRYMQYVYCVQCTYFMPTQIVFSSRCFLFLAKVFRHNINRQWIALKYMQKTMAQ